MTSRQLKDSNWASARRSIMAKYNKNGDGHYEEKEVEGIIDDYMGTIYNHQTLEHKNQTQKRMILFGAIMIVLLTLSNLGTGIAAAFIAKDTKVVDGKLSGTGGDDDEGFAIATETSIRIFDVDTKMFEFDLLRRMQEDDVTVAETIACISKGTSKKIFDAVTSAGQANVRVMSQDESMEKKSFSGKNMNAFGIDDKVRHVMKFSGRVSFAKPLNSLKSDYSIMRFPDSKVEIDSDDELCKTKGKFALKRMDFSSSF